ncbi:tetratricopeptide repeat protein [Flavobacterium sp. JP2137]|uniref:tetratricopeptide repeat protein n=1 Tax=Flavobacterium sp. JP2137 TaxID=3414510 RepID=UPI003D2FC05E
MKTIRHKVLTSNYSLRNGILLMLLLSSIFSYGQIDIDLNDKEALTEKINSFCKKGEWETAKNWLDISLKKHPDDSELRMLLGKYYIEKKRYQKARFELNKSLIIKPNNSDSKKLLLHLETVTKRYSSAIGYVNDLLKSSPYSKELWLKKIDLYRKQGNAIEADRLLKRLAEIYPEDPSILRNLNYQMEVAIAQKRKLGQFDEVIELNKSLLKANPTTLEYYLDLIDLYIKTGDYSQALNITERGLNQFPNRSELVLKKLSLYDQSQQYEAGLQYINQQKKLSNSSYLDQQYDYFLSLAAQSVKNGNPLVLFGKILEKDAGNTEAFDQVFNQLVAQHQYDEALAVLNRYRKATGNSKNLDLRELTVSKAIGDVFKTKALLRKLYAKYPQDLDLQAAYVQLTIQDAQDAMRDNNYTMSLDLWKTVNQLGDQVQIDLARAGLYHTYLQMGNYSEAEATLNAMSDWQSQQIPHFFKMAELYYLQNRIDDAITSYELGIQKTDLAQKAYALKGYEELMVKIIKKSLEDFAFPTAMQHTARWLEQDSINQQALHYAINFSVTMKQWKNMKHYAQIAADAYPSDSHFKIKLAESLQLSDHNYEESLQLLSAAVTANPYHEKLSAAYIQTVSNYSQQLLKDKNAQRLLDLTTTALALNPNDKEIKYLKGLAYEQQKNDSAYYYQKNYEPALLEVAEFKQHLNYLYFKTLKNQLSTTQIISRLQNSGSFQNTTNLLYSRQGENQLWTAQANYTGKSDGQGVQGIAGWTKQWSPRWSHQIGLGIANNYFPKIITEASLIRSWTNGWEGEAGLGFRQLSTDEKLYNLLFSVSKEFDDFRIDLKLNQFSLEKIWLYNLGINGKYFMESPKNYLLLLGGIGSSPAVELIDLQNLNTFSIINTQVGAGMGRLIAKNISANIIGTWYHFKSQDQVTIYGEENNSMPTSIQNNFSYKNFYTLYLHVNVAF